jgi:hypothetical protein
MLIIQFERHPFFYNRTYYMGELFNGGLKLYVVVRRFFEFKHNVHRPVNNSGESLWLRQTPQKIQKKTSL